MKALIVPAALAVLFGATAAHATVTDITTNLATLPDSYTKTVDTNRFGILGTIDDYTFTVGSATTLTSSVTTTGLAVASEKLFERAVGSHGAYHEILGGLLGVSSLSGVSLVPTEDYEIVVGALGLNAGGRHPSTASYTLNASVSAVPLPAALPLFGSGIAALVGYGARKARRTVVA